MESTSKRPLIKGSLRPPDHQAFSFSTTRPPASKTEVQVKDSKSKAVPVVEFSSRAVPQPFLDPSVIERRIEVEKQWRVKQEKKESEMRDE